MNKINVLGLVRFVLTLPIFLIGFVILGLGVAILQVWEICSGVKSEWLVRVPGRGMRLRLGKEGWKKFKEQEQEEALNRLRTKMEEKGLV